MIFGSLQTETAAASAAPARLRNPSIIVARCCRKLSTATDIAHFSVLIFARDSRDDRPICESDGYVTGLRKNCQLFIVSGAECTYVDGDAGQRKNLRRRRVTWHIAIELVAVFVPLHRVQRFVVQIVVTLQVCR